MSTFTNVCNIFVVFFLVAQTAAIEKGEVDGAIGYRRLFKAHSVHLLGTVTNVESSRSCCSECEKIHPASAMVNFYFQSQSCRCLKRKSSAVQPSTRHAGVLTGLCDQMLFESDIDGDVGEGRQLTPTSVQHLGSVQISGSSAECCQQCEKKFPGSQIFEFYYFHYCDCFKTIQGTRPETYGREYEARICGVNDEPELLALAMNKKGCKEGDHDIACCPHFTKGDNTLGEEKFIQEDQMSQGGCQETCQEKYPSSLGMTESLHEIYGNGKKKCWCEFGDPVLNKDENYQTCLF